MTYIDGKTHWYGVTYEWECSVDGDSADIERAYLKGGYWLEVHQLHPELQELICRQALEQAPFCPQGEWGTWSAAMLGVA